MVDPPQEDEICSVCVRPYRIGCKEPHRHDVYCIDMMDVRQLECGCYAHKACEACHG